MILRDGSIYELLSKKEKIVCFGAGQELKKFLEVFEGNEILKRIELVIDNYTDNKSIIIERNNIPIISHKELSNKREKIDCVIIVTVGTLNANCVLDEIENDDKLLNTEVYISEWLIKKSGREEFGIRTEKKALIPKTIHTIWFGNNKKTDLNKRCIESWYKYCPDFNIFEWNEGKYNSDNRYFSDAYNNGFYAHASDYARLDIIEKFGGLYLDTDVEIIRPIDDLLYNEAFAGVYNPYGNAYEVALGLGFGAIKKNKIVREMRDYYEGISFFRDGFPNDTPNTRYQTEFLKTKGFKSNNKIQVISGLTVYPSDVLSPMDAQSREINITQNTYMIHHYESSWADYTRKKNNDMFIIESRKLRERLVLE